MSGKCQICIKRANKFKGKSFSSSMLEAVTSKKVFKMPMLRKFPEGDWKYSAYLTQLMRSFREKAIPKWFLPAEFQTFVDFVTGLLQEPNFSKRSTSSNRRCPVCWALLKSGQVVPRLVRKLRIAGKMNQFMIFYKF